MRGFLRAIQCLNIVARPNNNFEVVAKDGAFPIFIPLGNTSTSYLRLIFSLAFNLETRLGNGCFEPMRTIISYWRLADSSGYTITMFNISLHANPRTLREGRPEVTVCMRPPAVCCTQLDPWRSTKKWSKVLTIWLKAFGIIFRVK